MNYIRAMLRRMKAYPWLTCVFVGGILIEVAYAVAAPLSIKYLVDEAFLPRDLSAFFLILLLLIGGGLINIGANIFGDYAIGKLSGEIIRQFREELFAVLQRQSQPFYQRYRVGDLVTRFSGDMSSMERTVRFGVPMFLKELLSVSMGLTLLFTLEWKLTLAVLAGSLLMVLGPRLMQSRAEAANSAFKEAQERFTNTIDEMVKGHRTIKGLHQQARFGEKARLQIRELFSSGLKLHMNTALMERLPLTALLILNGTMIGFGGYLIFQDQMTVGDFMAFFTLFMSVGQSGTNLTYLIPGLIEANIGYGRIDELLRQRPSVPEAELPVELPETAASLRMEHVTFGYSEDKKQLQDVSLHIGRGAYVALVGPSGSGKSTALQLLARFYDPSVGAVTMDEIDLRAVSEADLRRQATLVSQETFLFESTVRDNLKLEHTELTDDDMIRAARQAHIHDAVSNWPDGYDTWIHNGGSSLSGGEKQRLSIARAILRNPKVLLLDEITAALDPATESAINRLIGELRSDKTIVSVTHRLASVVDADVIHVFRDGRVVESGTHEELLAHEGLYRTLWDKQNGFRLSQDGMHASVDEEWLAKLPFFAGMEPAVLQDIAARFATETCKADDIVIREGEEGNKFYIIVRGKFEVSRSGSDGQPQRLAVLQDGDHFGEIALLRNIPRTATVTSLGSATLLSMRREAFGQLTDKYPALLYTLERVLEQRM
ncbi:ABC transporter transmembrane domain-containing protein [Cohnella panacarvi]|uniref:ABC transporter transmembrane domain-containing protein n=1 Tax=Cohnella panacarvi TaxID=400776 RepID=UPI0004789011|nr:ABC transporter transmembrane domain-containing protein [Cohnella panacarvi]